MIEYCIKIFDFSDSSNFLKIFYELKLHLGLHGMLENPLYRIVALSIPLKSQYTSL